MNSRFATHCLILAIACVGAISLFGATSNSDQKHPALIVDLRPYGFPDYHKDRHIVDYTGVQFLSDNLVLVSLNKHVHMSPQEPLFTDEPPSKLLLFDVGQERLVLTAEYRVEKAGSSVLATQNGQFVVLNQAGVHVCNSDLSCGAPFTTKGPIRVLPGGTQLLVGGNGQTEVDLLDASTLRVLSSPAPRSLEMDFMGGGILLDGGELINNSTVAETGKGDVREMPVKAVDGRTLYRVPVTAQYETTVVANRTGSRFCAVEESYTRWNKIVNFLDIDTGRPPNFARVRVFDTPSGKQLFEMQWDPRPSLVRPPALSPDGHRLALIRHSELEVFEIP